MKRTLVASACANLRQDKLVKQILLRCGRYYQGGKLFYHRLWKQWLNGLGFRVICVERLDCHDLWDLRLRLAPSKPAVGRPATTRWVELKDPMEKLKLQIRQIARELGPPIQADGITVVRSGAYYRAIFIWPAGEPGLLLRTEKKPEAFSFLIRRCLRRNRN